jgi:tetratricopeptide (TPR) repeat protein
MYLGMTPLRADIAMNLGRALLARGKIDEANQSFAAANAYWLEYDATNRNAGLAAYWLARGRLAGGEEDEARAGFLRAAEILKKSPLPADARQARDARSLVAKL